MGSGFWVKWSRHLHYILALPRFLLTYLQCYFELLTSMIMYESIDALEMGGSFSDHSCSSC